MATITKVVGLLGLGGLLGLYFRILWERRNTALIQKQEFKETRYKCIILLMLGALDIVGQVFCLYMSLLVLKK